MPSLDKSDFYESMDLINRTPNCFKGNPAHQDRTNLFEKLEGRISGRLLLTQKKAARKLRRQALRMLGVSHKTLTLRRALVAVQRAEVSI